MKRRASNRRSSSAQPPPDSTGCASSGNDIIEEWHQFRAVRLVQAILETAHQFTVVTAGKRTSDGRRISNRESGIGERYF
jgi:hypothetical protein